MLSDLVIPSDARILAGIGNGEDAAIVAFPNGKHMVQSVDFFTPILNDPFKFGQIAAANSLSDIYAMGGEPYVVMNIVCFPINEMDADVLKQILKGGLSKISEAGAFLVGGHSVQDKEIKYGLSVTGTVDINSYATNKGLVPDCDLLLTKPIGSGVLGTAIKADWENVAAIEAEIFRWAAKLNKIGGLAIQKFKLKAATDVTGFGLGGHLLEMATASNCSIVLDTNSVPLMDYAYELAMVGLIPAGSYSNKQFCQKSIRVEGGVSSLLVDLMFDAQTSGGLVLGVPKEITDSVQSWLRERGEMAEVIGRTHPARSDGLRLTLC